MELNRTQRIAITTANASALSIKPVDMLLHILDLQQAECDALLGIPFRNEHTNDLLRRQEKNLHHLKSILATAAADLEWQNQ